MRKALLTVLIFLAIFIRFYKLGDIPSGLSTDEADLAYNAYSILKTGADVYGQKLPFFFQSLDDAKPGLVFYTTAPAVLVFGLTDFATRLAPAILGLLTLPLIFIVTKLLYPKNMTLPYISTILMSFAPWHIALSRAMVWYIEIIFLYLLFLACFLFAQKENLKTKIKAASLSLSFVFLALTLYVYYAAIIYLPFLLLTVAIIYRDFLKKNFKIVIVGLSLLVILSLPAVRNYTRQDARSRLNAISVLTPDITLPTSIAEIEQDKQEGQPFWRILHNRRLVYLSALLDNYFDYFNLDYLFISAKNIRYFYVNGVGLFYLLELPFTLYGLYLLAKRREKSGILILALLLIGPIPASLTLGSPFPHRALLTIVSTQIISAIGLAAVLVKSQGFNFLKLGLTTLYAASVYFFLHQYFIHSPKEFTSESDNGAWYSTVRGAIPKVNQYKNKYDKVIFTWSYPKLVPSVYFLFYNQVDPRILQAKSAGWTENPPSYRQIYSQIENIEFRSINWERDQNLKNTLLVGYASDFPQEAEPIDQTYLPNGKRHFLFVPSLK